jgi:hypothetical protein
MLTLLIVKFKTWTVSLTNSSLISSKFKTSSGTREINRPKLKWWIRFKWMVIIIILSSRTLIRLRIHSREQSCSRNFGWCHNNRRSEATPTRDQFLFQLNKTLNISLPQMFLKVTKDLKWILRRIKVRTNSWRRPFIIRCIKLLLRVSARALGLTKFLISKTWTTPQIYLETYKGLKPMFSINSCRLSRHSWGL